MNVAFRTNNYLLGTKSLLVVIKFRSLGSRICREEYIFFSRLMNDVLDKKENKWFTWTTSLFFSIG